MKNYVFYLVLFLSGFVPATPFAQTPQWHYLGDTIIEQTWSTNVLTYLDGDAPYVAYEMFDNNFLTYWIVRRFDGNSWVPVDTNGLGVHHFHLLGATANGNLQMAYFNQDSMRFGLKRLIGSTWEEITQSPQLDHYPYLASYAFDDEKFYAAFPDQNLEDKISVFAFDGNDWSVLGQPGFSTGRVHSVVLKVSNGIPWVAYLDRSLGNAGMVHKLEGSTWQVIGNQLFDGDVHGRMDMTVSNGVPYIAHADSSTQAKPRVLTFDGNDWTAVGQALPNSSSYFLKLSVDESLQKPYLLVEESDPNFWGLSALAFEAGNWVYVGTKGFIDNFWNLEFSINNSVPMVGYSRSPFGGGASVQAFSPVSAAPEPPAPRIDLSVSPNPVLGKTLKVQTVCEESMRAIAQIYDLDGRLRWTSNTMIEKGNTQLEFSIGTLASGSYLFQLRSTSGNMLGTKWFIVI